MQNAADELVEELIDGGIEKHIAHLTVGVYSLMLYLDNEAPGKYWSFSDLYRKLLTMALENDNFIVVPPDDFAQVLAILVVSEAAELNKAQ